MQPKFLPPIESTCSNLEIGAQTMATSSMAQNVLLNHRLNDSPPTKRRSDPAQWVTELNGEPKFPALELVTRPNLRTEEAAYYLNRAPQTLRSWACKENGPLRARRINGFLAWSTAEVKALAGVSE